MYIGISVFVYKNKEKHPEYVSKNVVKKNMLIYYSQEKGKKHYVIIKDFNRCMQDHSLHRERKCFCRYCLHTFVIQQILKHHINDCFKINGKQRIIMSKKGEHVKLKVLKEK